MHISCKFVTVWNCDSCNCSINDRIAKYFFTFTQKSFALAVADIIAKLRAILRNKIGKNFTISVLFVNSAQCTLWPIQCKILRTRNHRILTSLTILVTITLSDFNQFSNCSSTKENRIFDKTCRIFPIITWMYSHAAFEKLNGQIWSLCVLFKLQSDTDGLQRHFFMLSWFIAKWIGRPALTVAIDWYVTGWSRNVRRLVKSAYDTLTSRLHASSSANVKLSANKNDGANCSHTYWLVYQSLLPYLATCSTSTSPNASWLPPVLHLSVTYYYLPELMYCEPNGSH